MKADNIQDIYELSPLQQGILFHSLYAPESAVYFVQLCYSLKGNFNVVAFEQAWQEVVNRHTVLRTAFYWENLEKPLQVVHREVEVSLIQHDWRDIKPNEQPQKLQELLESDRTCNFDLTQPCLMRLNLIRYNDDCYYFVWSKHHLILDGWSTALVLKEVVEIYKSLYQGKNLPLVLDTSFGNYIGWLQQQDINKAKDFWQQLLQGVTAPTPLINLNTQDSFKQPEKYNQQVIKLSQTTTATLQSLARQNQLTLNTLVQGAYALLLSRYSRETDVVYGVTVSGRPADLVNAESMVGMFINTLPIRVKINAEESLLSWLRKLQSQLAEIRQYEYSPLVEVQGWSEVPRGLPLFESILVFENYPIDAALKNGMKDLEIQSISSVDNTNYPLTVTVIPSFELELRISYDCDRFHSDTITRMLGHLVTLLENLIADVSQPLASLSMLTKVEQHQLLVDFNNTQADYPKNECIHHLFEEQVEKVPDALAVVFKDEQLTYRELNIRANQIAHYLQQLGVKPEVPVGICVERSLEMVIGLLGILKAGGAYLPIEPTYPKERLAFILQDAQTPVLLTQQHLAANLPTDATQVICLDTDWQIISQQPIDNPVNDITTLNLAYIIYTSGSTGKPKGTLIHHQGLVNYLSWCTQAYNLDQGTGTIVHSPLGFDLTITSLFSPLLVGNQVEILSPDQGIETLANALRARSNLSLVKITPAHLKLLCQMLSPQEAAGRTRAFIIGGENLLAEDIAFWREFAPDTMLVNEYGPTETVVGCCIYQVPTGENLSTSVAIGNPIANTQLYVLDQHCQPVPIGVVGELHIGGLGLARGYLNQPELTAQKFIPNPFSQIPGERLYKTGDLARYRPDGVLEFLGRIDDQVKIRGFRIELGEIEATINQHPCVSTSVVVVRKDESANQTLVAYITLQPQQTLAIPELRRFLEPKLPNYMIPSAFVTLDILPLTSNGKVDHKALPAVENFRPELAVAYLLPQTEVEQTIADVWQKSLKIEKIGIHDNFFELGGHSLLLITVHSQLREIFKTELSILDLFRYPTISYLADYLNSSQQKTISLQETDIQTDKILDGKAQQKKRLQKMKSIINN
ncbi:non-ribosomal peptide synthetase [Nostoc sp. UIC 10630]|uniref:non-ribosomal peptide synthetase n=2 Tax=unclassified Nostoc TaxID=2593658 RepID=UPI0013D408EF|nr:non-ribosomal peptide synthetase [Nostoc sp. UIC 10630]NEU77735.1 amino acid adenylation domain-containing protein [Nostoc sp. UIC 10630]QID92146.1 nonribosomal peptide synthetase [Nostoc sp. UIC 10630]